MRSWEWKGYNFNLFPPVRNSQVWNYHTSHIARFERVTKQKLFKLKGDFFLREQGLISLHWWSNVTFQISLVIFLINKDVEYRYLNINWISYIACVSYRYWWGSTEQSQRTWCWLYLQNRPQQRQPWYSQGNWKQPGCCGSNHWMYWSWVELPYSNLCMFYSTPELGYFDNVESAGWVVSGLDKLNGL